MQHTSNRQFSPQRVSDLRETRKECMRLYAELQEWDGVLFNNVLVDIRHTIKFSYNQTRLNSIHSRLTAMINSAMLDKISQGL
jgi:hypothetical protein